MSKMQTTRRVRAVSATKTMTTCALLAAMAVVLARLVIPMPNETTRFSIEAVPTFLAGMLYGPVAGALVGFVSDFVGTLFSPYGYNPLFALPPILYGLCAGIFRPFLLRKASVLRIATAFLPAVVLGSVLWQSFALAFVYGGEKFSASFAAFLTSRSIQFAVTFVLDVLIVFLLQKSRVLEAAKLLKNSKEEGIQK